VGTIYLGRKKGTLNGFNVRASISGGKREGDEERKIDE